MRKSIRWRLLFSYGAIALLAALAQGAVLLPTLRSYYLRQEYEHLTENAHEVAEAVEQLLMVERAPSRSDYRLVAETYSSLTQTRVQVYNRHNQLLADSGPPETSYRISGPVSQERLMIPGTPNWIYVVEGDGQVVTYSVGRYQIDSSVQTLTLTYPYFRVGDVQGVSATDVPRSDQSVRVDYHDWQGKNRQGTIQLSEGPAYGREIVSSAARLWIIAGIVAVVLAAGAGWLVSWGISRGLLVLTDTTAQMARGDLRARAQVGRSDEIGTLASSFNQMATRVEEMVTALRRFVADASHELHTPLTTLATDLELATEVATEEGKEYLAQARAQVARLQALTQGLLQLSQLDGGVGPIASRPLDLAGLARQLSEVYASRAEQAGISFVLDLPETPCIALGCADQLSSAIGNLLDNAVKFIPEGGSIRLSLHRDPEGCTLSVQDSGAGIPEQDLPHLFERFHRGSNASAYAGSGLGLSIVKAVIEAHGGWVRGENVPPGARFTLWLPGYQEPTS